VVGFYRYVRNPMYLGFLVGWGGLWVIFGRANMAAIAVASVIVLCVVLFVLLYEEPSCGSCSARSMKSIAGTSADGCRGRTRGAGKMRRGSDALEGFGYVVVGVAQGYRVAMGCSVLA
jgi:hypothetical protein